MSISSLIIDTLKPLGAPVSFLAYAGTSRPYIVFYEIDQRAGFTSDNAETITEYIMQVDVFHTGNYNSLVYSVKQSMHDAGFRRMNEYDFFEADTKLYHKVLRFSYFEEV